VLAAVALLAGCGTASSTTTTTAAANAGATPTTSTTGGQFDPNLVPAGGSSASADPKSSAKKSSSGGSSSTSSTSSTSGTTATTGSTAGSSTGSAATGSAPSGGGPANTVTVSHTIVLTHYVRPDVPAGAGLPSRAPALSSSSFAAAKGNIGCRIRGGTVRCDVGSRVWTPPRKPASCRVAWGQGLILGSSGSAHFVCARSSVLDPTGREIRSGYDDTVGSVTCQVRSFGVTCFESDGHGFFIGRTGYTIF
jgi:hypothetical protein